MGVAGMSKGLSETQAIERARRAAVRLVCTFDDFSGVQTADACAAAWELRAREADEAVVQGIRAKYREAYYQAYRVAVRDLIDAGRKA
jgi:hypothetical protein